MEQRQHVVAGLDEPAPERRAEPVGAGASQAQDFRELRAVREVPPGIERSGAEPARVESRMQVPEQQLRREMPARRLRALPRVAGVAREAELEPRSAAPVQAPGERWMREQRLRGLLPALTDAAPRLEPGGVESFHHVRAIRCAVRQLTEDAGPRPGP